MTGHVFVSHSSDNREQANELAAMLEASGAQVWIAPRDVRPGMDYSEQLQLAIEQCIAFVVLITEQSNKSPYVRAETEMAFSTEKPLFPVRMSNIQPAAGLALFLKIRHWTDAYGASRQANLDQLAREIRGLSGLTQIAAGPFANPAAKTSPPAAVPPAPPAPAPQMAPPPVPADAVTMPPQPIAAPVAAVAAPVPAVPLPTTAEDEARWRAAIGPKADYYLAHWRKMSAKGASYDWNWAACLLNMFWFAYRKMWLVLVLFLLANVVAGVVGAAAPDPTRATLLLTIGLTFVTGYFGNHWYRRQVGRLVAEAAPLDQPTALAQLSRKGGISAPAAAVLLAITLAITLLSILVAMAQLQRQQQQNSLFGPQDDKPIDSQTPAETPAEGETPPPADQQTY